MIRCDVKTGKLIDVNQRMADISGYSIEELRHLSFSEITHPDDRNNDVIGFLKIKNGSMSTHKAEKRYVRKDGRIVWVKLEAAVCLRSASGIPLETVASVIDLTEERESLEETRRSESRFKGIFDSAMFGLIFWNEKGEIFDANEEFLNLVGYSREDLKAGKIDWRKMTPEEYVPLDVKSLAEFATIGKCTPYEKEYFHKDGSRVPLVVGGATLHEVSGIGGVGFILDNRARKKAETALRESEIYFRTLTEAIPQIVWTANTKGEYLFFNLRWTDYTGVTLQQTAKGGWDPVVHPEDLLMFNQRWKHSIETGEAYEMEYRLKRASDGSYRWHLRRALPLRDSAGEVTLWFGTCTDIHDQKSAFTAVVEAKNRVDAIISNTDAVLFSMNKWVS